jgi:hypothetical protein
VGGACQNNPNNALCDDGNACWEDICDPSDPGADANGCIYQRPFWWECVETSCDIYDNDCDGCLNEGCGGDVIEGVEVIPYSSGSGLRRISGNGQAGPWGKTLPNQLIVQVNDNGGSPIPCAEVTFAIAPADTVCYGRGGTYDPPSLPIIDVSQQCNNLVGGTLIGETVVLADANGQASIGLTLPSGDYGVVAVSATVTDSPIAVPPPTTVHFFAASGLRLRTALFAPEPHPHNSGDPCTTDAECDDGLWYSLDSCVDSDDNGSPDMCSNTPLANPALGPAKESSPGAGPAYLANLANFTLSITQLDALDTGASTDGVPWAPLVGAGRLEITGTDFGPGPVSVYVGGMPATLNGAPTATRIVVDIPEGIPGAAGVMVYDGGSTPFRIGHSLDGGATDGNLPNVAATPNSFWRTAPKPVFIYADTGGRNGTAAEVRLMALDSCGNMLDISGPPAPTLVVRNPDGSPSNAVFIDGGLDTVGGFATIRENDSEVRRSAVVAGTVEGISSDALLNGNTTVTTVTNMMTPNVFTDNGIGNSDGINTITMRGGSESNTTDAWNQNPGFRLFEANMDNYTIPDGISPVYETEAHIMTGDMWGWGDVICLSVDLTTVDAALAGTGLVVTSGGSNGLLMVVAATLSYNVTAMGSGEIVMSGITLAGKLTQDAVSQNIEFFEGALAWMAGEIGRRQLIMRLMVERALP